jgi:ankyrin repeat protein
MKNRMLIAAFLVGIQGACSQGSEFNQFNNCSPIHQAAYEGNIAKLEELVKAGANVNDNSCHKPQYTPLGVVADSDEPQEKARSVGTAQWLIEHGANMNQVGADGQSAVGLAVTNENIPLIGFLCDKGANKEIAFNGKTPLLWTANFGNSEAFNLLLAKGANPQIIDTKEAETIDIFGFKMTVGGEHEKLIHAAILGGNFDIIKSILEKGLQKATEVDANGDTPLHYINRLSLHNLVSDQVLQEMVAYLITKGANRDTKNNTGETAYDVAVNSMQKRDPDISEKWIERIVWVKALKSSKQQAVVKSTEANKKDMLATLTKSAKEAIAKEVAECSPMYQAAVQGDLTKLEALIKGGANVNEATCTSEKITPLGMVAIAVQEVQEKEQSVATAQWLIDHGANVEGVSGDATDANSPSVLAIAVLNDNAPLVALLCDKGANKDKKMPAGLTYILFSTLVGFTDVFNILLAKGANIQEPGSKGRKAIHLAAEECNLDIIKILVAKGLQKATEVDNDGNTALHYAAMGGRGNITPEQHLAVVQYLIAKTGKSGVQITNKQGQTAYDVALQMAKFRNHGVPEKWVARIPWVRALRSPTKAPVTPLQNETSTTKK